MVDEVKGKEHQGFNQLYPIGSGLLVELMSNKWYYTSDEHAKTHKKEKCWAELCYNWTFPSHIPSDDQEEEQVKQTDVMDE
jgi:hypothetical protein